PAPEKVAQADATPQAPTQTVTPETPARVTPVGEVTYEIAERAFLDGRYDEAVDLFTRYTEKKPDNSFGHYMLGLSAWKDGRLDIAEGEFQKSLTLDPNHQKSCLNLARVLIEGHRPTEALKVLDRAVEIDSTNGSAYRLKGNALGDLGRSDEAALAYQSAIQL